MLNDIEYAMQTGIDPTQLGEDINPFTFFELPLVTEDNRHHPLWEVKPITTTEGELNRQERDARQADQSTLLARYIERGYAFENPLEEAPSEEVEEVLTADQKFWGGATPTEELDL